MKTLAKYLRNALAGMFGFEREIELLKQKCEKLLWDSSFGVGSRAGWDGNTSFYDFIGMLSHKVLALKKQCCKNHEFCENHQLNIPISNSDNL